MQSRSTFLLALASCGMLGCADVAAPGAMRRVSHEQAASHSTTNGGDAPYYPTETDVPPEMRDPVITGLNARVSWERSTATGWATWAYWANRATATLTMGISSADGQVAGHSITDVKASFFAQEVRAGQPLSLAAPASCGHVANFAVSLQVSNVADVGAYRVDLGTTSGHARASAEQPACPTEDVHQPGSGDGGGGGGMGPTEIDEKKEVEKVTMCVVRYTYDLETGEVLSASVLYCY